ncbi:acylneuraminate cytidylyltransferase family protein [Lysinibacillus sp. A4]|uniref:acylneuraminate cytidylyltransferase family protein n=1 Tax=Lysinibacillus sp. A4 TaxID=2976269 RepID=UPI002175A79C|nr:acylneuraminate cytidylyltransferase family protein [Lysinibacillus sp. A4]MCS5503270.1 acylneuraminate cytidylyltransferase family protein [Lysinibacillus sp. A4]
MYKNKKILAVIPAREGSKGIPNKNIIVIQNKPLIAYTIEPALESKYIDKVIVSTDSEEIASISKEWGATVPFLRPSYLATDEAKTIETVIHVLELLESKYDYVILLQPTQPTRKVKHIDEAIEEIVNRSYTSLVSVSKVKEHPILMRTIDGEGKLQSIMNKGSIIRRQDFQDVYKVDGAIYINKVKGLNFETNLNDNEYAYIMDEKVIDIDETEDIREFEIYLKGNHQFKQKSK